MCAHIICVFAYCMLLLVSYINCMQQTLFWVNILFLSTLKEEETQIHHKLNVSKIYHRLFIRLPFEECIYLFFDSSCLDF